MQFFSSFDKTILKYRILKNLLLKRNIHKIKEGNKIFLEKKDDLNYEEESLIVRALFIIYFKYY